MSTPNFNSDALRWDDKTFEFDESFKTVREMLEHKDKLYDKKITFLLI